MNNVLNLNTIRTIANFLNYIEYSFFCHCSRMVWFIKWRW